MNNYPEQAKRVKRRNKAKWMGTLQRLWCLGLGFSLIRLNRSLRCSMINLRWKVYHFAFIPRLHCHASVVSKVPICHSRTWRLPKLINSRGLIHSNRVKNSYKNTNRILFTPKRKALSSFLERRWPQVPFHCQPQLAPPSIIFYHNVNGVHKRGGHVELW